MSMLSVQVTQWGKAPQAVQTTPRPEAPADPAASTVVQIRVLAAGLHQVVRSRASGKHYSMAASALPHTLGLDGTGIDVSTGKLVYFMTLSSGSFAELVNVPRRQVVEVPEGVDAVAAAALMNPVMSSWMGLRARVDLEEVVKKKKQSQQQHKDGHKDDHVQGWTCLIVGATTMSGRLAIKVARLMGATRVIGAARNQEALQKLDLDARIVLTESTTDFSTAADADVVLDYLYGPYLPAFLKSTGRSTGSVTWVGIGALAGEEAPVPLMALRKRDVTLRGAGIGSWSPKQLIGQGEGEELQGMLNVLKGVGVDEIKVVNMRDVEDVWGTVSQGKRVVFVTDAYHE